jgi:hypothetical protein
VSRYNVSFVVMGQIPHEGLVMAKKETTLKQCAIQCGMWPYVIWEQSGNNYASPFTKSSRWKQSQRCSKTIPKGPLANKCGMY